MFSHGDRADRIEKLLRDHLAKITEDNIGAITLSLHKEAIRLAKLTDGELEKIYQEEAYIIV